MKTLQGEIKRFSSLKMNDYYTRLVIRQLQLVETLADNYSEEYENIHNRIIKLFELLAHEKSPKYILPPEIQRIATQAYSLFNDTEFNHNSLSGLESSFCIFLHKIFFEWNPITGIVGHREPILPRGDPYADKPKPELHLDAPIHDDNAVREEIIREEEAKEEAKENETVENENPAPLAQPNPKLNLEKVTSYSNDHSQSQCDNGC